MNWGGTKVLFSLLLLAAALTAAPRSTFAAHGPKGGTFQETHFEVVKNFGPRNSGSGNVVNNCSVSATVTGNTVNNGMTADAPANKGSIATGTGNSNYFAISQDDASEGIDILFSGQTNTGLIDAANFGNNSSSNSGHASQVLNATQTNTNSTLTATATNSTGCSFSGPLNHGGHITGH